MVCAACTFPTATIKFLPQTGHPSVAAFYQPLSDPPMHILEGPYNANVPVASIVGTASTTSERLPAHGSLLGLLGAQPPVTYGYEWAITPDPVGSATIELYGPGQLPAQHLEWQPWAHVGQGIRDLPPSDSTDES